MYRQCLELSTAFIHGVENYKLVIRRCLAPAGSERETYGNESEANDHVPGADVWDWVSRGGHVENYDPDEAANESGNHCWDKPLRALGWNRLCFRNGFRNIGLLFFA